MGPGLLFERPMGTNSHDLEWYLKETPLLNFGAAPIQSLVDRRGWRSLASEERLAAIYEFVKNEIPLGYSARERITATEVLKDGYGQCNTKSILLMALLRGVGLPCRFHAFRIDKRVQRGVLPWLVYVLAPKELGHSWVEVRHAGRWTILEGAILDRDYLDGLRRRFPENANPFCGYAVAVDDLHEPRDQWRGDDTYIQHKAITQDLGVFDCPDDYFAAHASNIVGVKGWLWRHYFYALANRLVRQTRCWPRSVLTN
jgi:hypothetical protein